MKRLIPKPDPTKKQETKNIKTKNDSSRQMHLKFNSRIISDKYIFNTNDYTIFTKPKIGGFGIINFVREKNTGKRYAAKTSYREMTAQERKFVLRELNILMKVQHPTIIRFEGISYNDFQGNDNLTIFMEYMENGALSDLIEKESRSLLPTDFDDTKRQIILVGISRGMMLLHKKNVIHRDLKPENVLLDKDYKPRITDFGLSKIFNPQHSQSQSMSNFGTLAYMAPEIIDGNKFSVKADVYAFGILMYEVLTGTRAYKSVINKKEFNIFQFMKSISRGARPEFTSENQVKKPLRKMIEKCWSFDPKDRPTFSEIFSKLSLSSDDFYVDSDNNICEPVIDDDNESDEMDKKYFLDGVDFDELFQYIDEINDDELTINCKEDMQPLMDQIKELKEINKKLEEEVCELKRDNLQIKNEKNANLQLKNDILQLKKENMQLKNDTFQLKNENKKFSNEITDLKNKISKIKSEPKKENSFTLSETSTVKNEPQEKSSFSSSEKSTFKNEPQEKSNFSSSEKSKFKNEPQEKRSFTESKNDQPNNDFYDVETYKERKEHKYRSFSEEERKYILNNYIYKYEKSGNGFLDFDEFLKVMLVYYHLDDPSSHIMKQMRFAYDGLDLERSNNLCPYIVIDFLEKVANKDYQFITRIMFRGADYDRDRIVLIDEFEDVCFDFYEFTFHEGDFRRICMNEFGKKKKKLEYWEFHKVITGEIIDKESPYIDPYEGKLPDKSTCCILI